jgi:hypothetical protein
MRKTDYIKPASAEDDDREWHGVVVSDEASYARVMRDRIELLAKPEYLAADCSRAPGIRRRIARNEDRIDSARRSTGLSLRTDFFFWQILGLWIGYTDAERVRRLMEHARWWLSRGEGKWARFAATEARKILRDKFPSRERRCRMEALAQPCPAVRMPTPAAAEEAYQNLYVAHFGADRKAAA